MSKAARHWSESESKDNVKCNQNSKAYLLTCSRILNGLDCKVYLTF